MKTSTLIIATIIGMLFAANHINVHAVDKELNYPAPTNHQLDERCLRLEERVKELEILSDATMRAYRDIEKKAKKKEKLEVIIPAG